MQMPDLTGKLPSNARVERHANGCYDWGTIGWLLDTKKVRGSAAACMRNESPLSLLTHRRVFRSKACMHAGKCLGRYRHRSLALQVDTSKYNYFIFMNSSVRGPFIPTYGQVRHSTALHTCLTWTGTLTAEAQHSTAGGTTTVLQHLAQSTISTQPQNANFAETPPGNRLRVSRSQALP